MKLESLRALYIHELNDLHDEEHQLLKALPKMSQAASFEDLRLAFERHLEQTHQHARRLENALSELEEKPARVSCKAMRGLIKEGEEMINAEGDAAIKDMGLISVAQRVAHYEMAGYGCARTYAEMLGEKHATGVFQKTLDEERAMDQSLTWLAERLMHAEPVQV
ncbi:MAG: ferritin-like domain-containing protein [Planctomycetes bacterium]|nr:ferritin-like domain-containing protein [Planctomycetota bacterium]MBI3832867.1 ferritin-like domain-containing protein [Planctomycetota bacterium]